MSLNCNQVLVHYRAYEYRINASAIKDLHYSWFLKILSKLPKPLLIYYMTEKIACASVLICTVVQIKNCQ